MRALSSVLLAVVALAVVASALSPSTTFYGSTPRGWRKGKRVGHDAHVPVIFAIRQRNLDKAEAILLEISNPKSEHWGEHLTLEEVRMLTADYAAARGVVAWLMSEGVARDRVVVTPNHDFVHATLTVKQAEELFDTEFYYFWHPAVDRLHVQAEEYTLPKHIDDLTDFVTASQVFPNAHPRAQKKPIAAVNGWPADQPFPPPGWVVPQVIWRVYGIANPSVTNQASTQSVYENLAQSYAPQDLQQFQQTFNIAVNPIANLIGPNNASDCFVNPGDCGEAELDVEYIMGVAQNSPTWFWSIGDDDNYPFLDWLIAVGNTANAPYVHSVSYGDIEQEGSPYDVMQRFNTEAMKLGLRGISVMVASGDDGVANFIARNNASACGFNPSYPASAPYVTAVGATQGPELNQTEIACTSTTGGGITTGGGFSTVYAQPSYQSTAVNNYLSNGPNLPPTNQFNASGRGYPDVAVMGHSYITVGGGNFSGADGTSASAPVFAGMITLINDARLQAGKKAIGFLNQIIYQLAASNSAAFNDVTSGTNNCAAGEPGQQVCCQYGFTATNGWDPLTGWGSPHFPVFSQYLISLP